MISPSIVRAYDIRGEYGTTLTEDGAFYIGKRLATFLHNKGEKRMVLVARDVRSHSPSLSKALVEGILSCGIDVVDVEVGPTPYLWYVTHVLNVSMGVMVTASHNPSQYNGFKIALKEEGPLKGEALKNIIFGPQEDISAVTPQPISSISFLHVYTKMLREFFLNNLTPNGEAFLKTQTIVWDASNGAMLPALDLLVWSLPFQSIISNPQLGGQGDESTNLSYEIDIKKLQGTVLATRASMGIAFDGDGDRLGVVDGKGRVVSTDHLMLIWVRDILEKNKGGTIIADVKTSLLVQEEVERLQGRFVRCRTGHSYIREALHKEKAIFAGEMSGHIFFNDQYYYGFDDGLYAALRLLLILANTQQTMDSLYDTLPKTYTSDEIKVFCEDDQKMPYLDRVKRKLGEKSIPYTTMDGIRYEDERGWWIIRSSNTGPHITVRYEGRSEEDFEFIQTHLDNVIQSVAR